MTILVARDLELSMALKCICRIILLAIVILKEVQSLINHNLMLDYFKYKSLRQVIIFSCESQFEMGRLAKFVIDNEMYVSIFNPNIMQYNVTEILHTNHIHYGVVLDADCKNSQTLLTQCGNAQKFGDQFFWLIFNNNNKILKVLSQTTIHVNAEITVASPVANNSYWKLLDVYNPGSGNGGSLKVTEKGVWSAKSGFKINEIMLADKYWRRKDLSELNILGCTVLLYNVSGDLFEYFYHNDKNRSINNLSRLQFFLWDHLKDLHNFSLEISHVPMFGAPFPNGSFSGVVGVLQRKEADISLSPIYYKVERIPYIDFLTPTYAMKTRFIFIHPKPPFAIRGTFFSPLSEVVWMCTWGVMIMTGLIIRVVFKIEREIEDKNDVKDSYTEYDWSYISLLVFGGICQQDVPKIPNLYSGRTVVFTSVLFTYMVYQFYSGGIVSSLLSEAPRSINNLVDLLQSNLEIGIEDMPYQKDFFDQTKDPVALELFRTRVAGKRNGSNAYYKEQEGMELVRQGGFAYQSDTATSYDIIAQTFSNEAICELGEVELFPIQKMTGVVPQSSPFREIFVYGFQRMTEYGLAYRQRMHWSTHKPECIQISDSSNIFVDIDEFFPALLFYAVGIVISLFIFVCELILSRKKQVRVGLNHNNRKIRVMKKRPKK